MRTVDAVALAVRERYSNGWREELRKPGSLALSFPLSPPDGRTIEREWNTVDAWIAHWHAWAASRPGTRLAHKEIMTPALGRQPVPTRLVFDSADALAAATDEDAAHWALARERWRLLTEGGLTPPSVQRRLTAIVGAPDADFRLLLAAAEFFRANPRSGLMPREVPVEGMHTKWLAAHRGTLLALLGSDDAEDAVGDEPEQRELDALGLVVPPLQADLILTDPADRARLGGLCHLRAPVGELATLPLRPTRVLIVENKESALLVPDGPGLVVVHSLGRNLRALTGLPWIHGTRVLYWGDLDRAGLALLSQVRGLFPCTESVLMNAPDFERHRHMAVPDDTRAEPPLDTLTTAEQAALELVRTGPLRLEQERLPRAAVLTALKATLAP